MAVVEVERAGGVVTVTLNRPEVKNPMNPEMVVRLARLWDELRADPGVRAVVLTGAAGSTFCAGADLGSLAPLETGARPPADEWDKAIIDEPSLPRRAILTAVELGKPLVVAGNGHAIAGGMLLLLAGDVRVAATGARLGFTELKLGLPGIGAVRLARELPSAVARQVLFTGEPISAERGFEVGFINEVAPAAQVGSVAQRLAASIAVCAPLAVKATSEVLRVSVGMSEADAQALEAARAEEIFATEDAREGPRAYMEKRTPVFQGR